MIMTHLLAYVNFIENIGFMIVLQFGMQGIPKLAHFLMVSNAT